MRVLGVGGTSSGVGKTAVVCLLLEALPGWGAVKTSVHDATPRGGPLPGGFEIVSDPVVLAEPGTDTGRLTAAGAARVRWLRSRRDALAAGIEQVLGGFEDLPGVIVEGNSFAAHRAPDALVLVARTRFREIKPSARELRHDWLVLNRSGDDDVARDVSRLAEVFGSAAPARLVVLDAASSEDAGSAQLLEEVRAWSRR